MSKRFDVVDGLRGFAILGILLLHSIEHFGFHVYPDSSTQSEAMVSMNEGIWQTLFYIFGGKAYGIFAMLFGFTFHLQFSRQKKNGIDFAPRFAWRMLILFCFGLFNSMFFPGEILATYALLSPTLLLVRKWNNRAILVFAIFFLLQPYEIYKAVQCYFDADYTLPNYKLGYFWQQSQQNITEGSLLSIIKNAYYGVMVLITWSLGKGRIIQTIGLFALGVYLGRKNMFDNSYESVKRWIIIGVVSAIAFVGLLKLNTSFDPKHSWYYAALNNLTDSWKNLAQINAMVSIFAILFYTSIFRRITKPLLYYGRMSLSNYIMQSVIGALIFHPYALGLAERTNVFYSLLIGIVLLIGYVFICNWWIGRFKQGPLEKLWHRLTWLEWRIFNKKCCKTE